MYVKLNSGFVDEDFWNRHGLVQEHLQLLLVGCLGARGWGGGSVTPNILQQPVVATYSCLGPGLHVGPGTHVLVLLLHPAQLRVAVRVSYLLHQIKGEGADLLDGVDGNLVIQAPLLPLLDKIIVHLASAEENLENEN